MLFLDKLNRLVQEGYAHKARPSRWTLSFGLLSWFSIFPRVDKLPNVCQIDHMTAFNETTFHLYVTEICREGTSQNEEITRVLEER